MSEVRGALSTFADDLVDVSDYMKAQLDYVDIPAAPGFVLEVTESVESKLAALKLSVDQLVHR